jgi:hypothetical protein
MRPVGRRSLAALTLAFAAAAAVVFSAAAATRKKPREKMQCVVPSLKGEPLAGVRQLLRHEHCALGRWDGPAEGFVVWQSIRPKARRPSGTRVGFSLRDASWVNVSVTQVFDALGTYAIVSASVNSGSASMAGLPITFTILDGTTKQTLGTFSGTSAEQGSATSPNSCTLVESINQANTIQTWSGVAIAPYPACSFGSVAFPAADRSLITANFAGNSILAPSPPEPGKPLRAS